MNYRAVADTTATSSLLQGMKFDSQADYEWKGLSALDCLMNVTHRAGSESGK